MPLQRQLVDVPIVGGMDQRTDPQLSTRPISLSNCCYRKSGAIEKRYGSELVLDRSTGDRIVAQVTNPPPTASPPTPLHLTEFNGAAVRVGAEYLHTTTLNDVWNRADHVPSVDVTRTPVSISSSQAWSGDVASDGVRVCHVWCESTTRFGTGAVWAQIANLETGEVITASYYFGDGRQVKVCCLSGGEFVVTWIDSVSGNIKAASSSVSTFLWGSTSTIITDGVKATGTLITAYALEACDTVYAIAYETSAFAVSIKTFSSSHSLSTTTATGFTLTPVTSVALKWHRFTRLWWAAIGVTGGVKRMQYGSLDTSFVLETANTTVEDTESATPVVVNQTYQNIGIVEVSSVSAVIVYDTCIDSTDAGIAMVLVDTTPVVGTITRMRGDLSVMSRPWVYGEQLFFAAAHSPRWGQGFTDANHLIFETSIIPDSSICRVVGRFGPSIGLYPLPFSHVSGVYLINGVALTALPFEADTSGSNAALWSCRVTHQTLPRRSSVELGGALYLTGGALSVFDGTTVAEVGFFGPPGIESTATPASGTLPAGDYTYIFVWEGIDAAGRVHRSPPSAPVTVTAALNDRIDIAVRQLSATTKQDRYQSGAASGKWPFAINLVFYKLLNGEYYRLGAITNYSPAYMQTLFDDGSVPDATLATNERLYTSGNVLPHVAPPGCRVLCAHQSRLFCDSDDGTIWYSNPVAPGEIASFTLDFRIPPFEGGDVTALVSLDSSLVVFKDSSIYVIGGQGPNATGGGDQYGLPQVLTADLGCVNPRSIVVCPLGIFFQSRDGITLLTRSLQVNTDVGGRIETTLASLPTIGSATHVPEQNQVRFELYSSSDNARAVYDYHNDAWSIDTLYTPDSVDETSSPAFGSVLIDGVYYWATEDGSLYRETSSSWLDSSNWVYMIAAFGNVRVGAIDGMMRLWRTSLNVFRYTTAGVVSGSKTWTAAEVDAIATAAGTSRIQLQEHIASQLREFYTGSFVDTPPSGAYGTGRGFSLTGLTLEVGVRGTTSRRLAAGARK